MPTTWKELLPPWPQVPPRLWLTLGLAALSALNLIFAAEIWSQHPDAGVWWLVILAGSLLLAGPQVVAVLWRWRRAHAGPWWAIALFRLAVLGALGGLLISEAVGVVALLVYCLV